MDTLRVCQALTTRSECAYITQARIIPHAMQACTIHSLQYLPPLSGHIIVQHSSSDLDLSKVLANTPQLSEMHIHSVVTEQTPSTTYKTSLHTPFTSYKTCLPTTPPPFPASLQMQQYLHSNISHRPIVGSYRLTQANRRLIYYLSYKYPHLRYCNNFCDTFSGIIRGLLFAVVHSFVGEPQKKNYNRMSAIVNLELQRECIYIQVN